MRWLALALVLSTSIARADDLEVPGLDAPDLRGDALVWEDATFYLEPWDGGYGVRFPGVQRTTRRDAVGGAMPVRIVDSSLRTMVEIELAGEDCAPRRAESDPQVEGLRLFVKRDDLAPVLVKPFQISFPDGSSARLGPGVPVVPASGGDYAVAVRGDVVRLPIPTSSVGYVYARRKFVPAPEPASGPLYRVDRGTSVKLGPHAFEPRTSWLAPRSPKARETSLLRWSTRCIDLVVAAPTRALRASPRPPLRGAVGVGRLALARGHEILPGAPLTTPGGRDVAVAGGELRVGAVEPTGDLRSCFSSSLTLWRLEEPSPQGGSTRTRDLKLCAADKHVAPAATGGAVLADMRPLAPPSDVARPPSSAARTPKGVAYRVLSTRHGTRRPKETDTVEVHYAGWTTDGKLFDSSYQRGTTAKFPLRALIPGWTDALQVMAVGDHVRMWIPEELAYKGAIGRPAGMLVFDVELIAIQ
ncbi:MAG: FKBP-type peptidyl-prolyl cis-trans isomerase [Kofleriaceae bacterium]